MERFRNYYEALGLTRAASDMEVAQAYRAQVQKLQANPGADTALPLSERLKHLEEAYRALTHPASRKKHDEEVAWQATKRELEAEEARRQARRLKEEKDLAEALARIAQEAELAKAMTAELKTAEEIKHQQAQKQAVPEAGARLAKAENRPARSESDFVDTLPHDEDAPVADNGAVTQLTAAGTFAPRAIVGGVLLVLLFALAYWGLRSPPTPSPSAPVAVAPVAASPASAPLAAVSEPEIPAVSASASAAAASPKINSAKADEARQYQKVLQRIEQEHPELNPRHEKRRDDLIAFVATRVSVHLREGYPKAKALEIAVRDLETQDQTRRMIESMQAAKAKPAPESPPPVLDPGGHAGFDPKCRWVTPEQWSCK